MSTIATSSRLLKKRAVRQGIRVNCIYLIEIGIVTVLLLGSGCKRSNSTETKSVIGPTETPGPMMAEPFHGQVYRNSEKVLTLISKDECELAERGITFLCKYTKQDGRLRVIRTALGTTQVIYFRVKEEGLEDEDGIELLSPAAYKARLFEFEQARRIEDQLREKEREEAQQKLTQKLEEAARKRKVVEDSKLVTRTNAIFSLKHEERPGIPGVSDKRTVVVTDVSIKIQASSVFSKLNSNTEILFCDLSPSLELAKTDIYDYVVDFIQPEFKLPNEGQEAQSAPTIHDVVQKAFDSWKVKFPEAVSRRNDPDPSHVF